MTNQTKISTEIKKVNLDDAIVKLAKAKIEFYKKLSAPIPKEYLFTYTENDKTFTGYQAQYAINLFNDLLGIGKWGTISKIRKEETYNKAFLVVNETILWLVINWDKYLKIEEKKLFAPESLIEKIEIEGIGASYANRATNAYKGAKTSSFKNACRYLGMGKELYTDEFEEDLPEEKPVEINNSLSDDVNNLIKKINDSKTVEEVNNLNKEVKEIEGRKVQEIVVKTYNKKLLELSK